MRCVAFESAHLAALRLQPGQAPHFGHLLTHETGAGLAELGPAFAAVDENYVLACWGLAEIWPGRADCWALLGDELTGTRFAVLHRWVARQLTTSHENGYRRLETTIDPTFAPARRWAALLGFRREGLLRRYLPDGRDMLLYARTE